MKEVVKYFVIAGIVAGVIFAAYILLNGGGGLKPGDYYMDLGGTLAMQGSYYEVKGKTASLHMNPNSPGIVYNYKIKGDRLILTAAGQSVEMYVGSDRTSFSLDAEGTLKYVLVKK